MFPKVELPVNTETWTEMSSCEHMDGLFEAGGGVVVPGPTVRRPGPFFVCMFSSCLYGFWRVLGY